MYERIEPNAWVALRLPSDSLKVMQVVPNTWVPDQERESAARAGAPRTFFFIRQKLKEDSLRTISLGKYGSFPSNLIIHRPYHVTFEVQDKRQDETFNRLRIVPPEELYADVLAEEAAAASAPDGGAGKEMGDGVTLLAADEDVEYSVVGPKGEVVARSSRELLDEDARQTLSFEEIEDLKREGAGAGKELITKLMLRHTALDLKTQFSLSKYKLLKTRKYIRRFSVVPYDPTQMGNYLLEDKDAGSKILEMREEMVALVGCWANVHYGGDGVDVLPTPPTEGQSEYDDMILKKWRAGGLKEPLAESGRWLVVDDTGGLLVAALAEKMGILYPKSEEGLDASEWTETNTNTNGVSKGENSKAEASVSNHDDASLDDAMEVDQQETGSAVAGPGANGEGETGGEGQANGTCNPAGKIRPECRPPARNKRPHDFHIPYSNTNTITVIHPNSQANLSYLRQYGYDSTNPNHPPHPLLSHLLTLTWLQLLSPEADTTYSSAPPVVPADEVAGWKANRRGNYHRKRRRWARTRHIVDTTRGGNFSGLVVATSMDPVSALRHALPLLAGGAPVAVYSPALEPLARLADCYSVARRAAWMACGNGDDDDDDDEEAEAIPPDGGGGSSNGAATPRSGLARREGSDEFPVNPTLLLGVCIQTSRVRKWQVLPNRTHPVMTSRGGAEGYVLTGWRAVPVAGRVEARGKFLKRQKRGD